MSRLSSHCWHAALGLGLVLASPIAAVLAQHAVPGVFSLREEGREKLANRKHAQAIERGLQWLARHQCRNVSGALGILAVPYNAGIERLCLAGERLGGPT